MTSQPPQLDAPLQELVFFDLDRCLLTDDSISAFLTRLVDQGLIPKSTMLRGAVAYVAYRLNLANPESMIYRAIEHLEGLNEATLDAEAEAFFHDVAKFRYRPAVVDAAESHREAGRPMFILTGGLPYLAQRIADDLQLDGYCTTVAETRGGIYTGRVKDPPCVGAGKIVHAHKAALSIGQTLHGCWFYTDSFSDLPMLEVAARPVAVNPDGKLTRWARKFNWPVLD